MRRSIVLAVAAAFALILAGIATAAPPTRTTFDSDLSRFNDTSCNFTYLLHIQEHFVQTDLGNGRYLIHDESTITYTNVATNAVAWTSSVIEEQGTPSGVRDAGRFFQLRTPDGRLVSLGAGRVVLDSTFQVTGFTPMANPDVVSAVCEALGGHTL